MPRCLPAAYRGPAILMAVGVGFAFVGAIPIAITFGLGIKTSATIIGVGFVGFGAMMILPGVCWCFVVQHRTYKHWRKRRRTQEETPALSAMANSYGGMDCEYPESPAHETKEVEVETEAKAEVDVADEEKCLQQQER